MTIEVNGKSILLNEPTLGLVKKVGKILGLNPMNFGGWKPDEVIALTGDDERLQEVFNMIFSEKVSIEYINSLRPAEAVKEVDRVLAAFFTESFKLNASNGEQTSSESTHNLPPSNQDESEKAKANQLPFLRKVMN